jgi:hypothetical protein
MKKINFKLYREKRKQRLAVSGISPRADWMGIMGVFLILVISGIGYAGYLFIQLNTEALFEVEADPLQIDVSEQRKVKIKKTVEYIEQRNFDETVLN